jgi:hypothetical protein
MKGYTLMSNEKETIKEEFKNVIDSPTSLENKIEILYLMFEAEKNLARIDGRLEVLEEWKKSNDNR